MSPAYVEAEKKNKVDPLGPVLGFIILLVGGGFSWLVAPRVINWMETAEVNFGFFGPILPITFPNTWSPIFQRLAIGGFMFLLFFIIAMIVMMALMGGTAQGELDVSRKEVMEKKFGGGKQKKKRRRAR